MNLAPLLVWNKADNTKLHSYSKVALHKKDTSQQEVTHIIKRQNWHPARIFCIRVFNLFKCSQNKWK